MNSIQASHCLTLAYFLKTKVPADKYDQDVFADGIDLDEGKVKGCSLAWCTKIWPKIFGLRGIGVLEIKIINKLNDRLMWCVDEYIQQFFGLSYEECKQVFGHYQDNGRYKVTPKSQAKYLEKLVANKGYTYA